MARKSLTSKKEMARLEVAALEKAASEVSRRLAGVQEVLQLHERYAEVLARTRAYTNQHADIEGSLTNASSP